MWAALPNWIPLVYLDTPTSEPQDSQWSMRPQSPPLQKNISRYLNQKIPTSLELCTGKETLDIGTLCFRRPPQQPLVRLKQKLAAVCSLVSPSPSPRICLPSSGFPSPGDVFAFVWKCVFQKHSCPTGSICIFSRLHFISWHSWSWCTRYPMGILCCHLLHVKGTSCPLQRLTKAEYAVLWWIRVFRFYPLTGSIAPFSHESVLTVWLLKMWQ